MEAHGVYIGGASPLGSLPVALSSRALWLSCAARFAVRRTQSRRLAQRARRSGLDLVCTCGAEFDLSARRVVWWREAPPFKGPPLGKGGA